MHARHHYKQQQRDLPWQQNLQRASTPTTQQRQRRNTKNLDWVVLLGRVGLIENPFRVLGCLVTVAQSRRALLTCILNHVEKTFSLSGHTKSLIANTRVSFLRCFQ